MSTTEFPRGEVRPACRADNSTVPVVLNVKVRMEAQHFFSPLSLIDLLRGSFSFNLIERGGAELQGGTPASSYAL